MFLLLEEWFNFHLPHPLPASSFPNCAFSRLETNKKKKKEGKEELSDQTFSYGFNMFRFRRMVISKLLAISIYLLDGTSPMMLLMNSILVLTEGLTLYHFNLHREHQIKFISPELCCLESKCFNCVHLNLLDYHSAPCQHTKCSMYFWAESCNFALRLW